MEIVGLIIAGIVISLLGKVVIGPSVRDDIGLVTTAVCGVIGVLVGWYAVAGMGTTGDVEVVRWTIAILVGMVLAAIAALVTGRSLSGRL
ncbi:MAG: GlsB/YeaQ/YmgE family stress response membrane protein [Nocardioidaceae bacterium]